MTAASQPQLSCWGLIKSSSSGGVYGGTGVLGYRGTGVAPPPYVRQVIILLANLTLLSRQKVNLLMSFRLLLAMFDDSV